MAVPSGAGRVPWHLPSAAATIRACVGFPLPSEIPAPMRVTIQYCVV